MAAQKFAFSVMTDDVVDGIANLVAKDQGIRDAIRAAVAEAVGAHQEAADCVEAYEAIYDSERAAQTMPVSPAHSPADLAQRRRA